MDFGSVLNKSEPHLRTIIHLDMDYFYAQVEELCHPTLRTKPLGVQQKNFVVTCNYIARRHGVSKLMLVADAKTKCPSLVLVNGEDLTPYRQMSQRIFEILLNYTPNTEKLCLDENFMDISQLVAEREQALSRDSASEMNMPQVVGNVYPSDGTTLNACVCGCANRLAIGTHISKEIRNELQAKLGITCSAGISYNKLLAKLVGAQNKPNQQTVLVSTHTEQFMRELMYLNRITGIGQKTESLLLENGIANVEELQLCDMDFLRKKFGFETATKLKDLAFGRDTSSVRPTGKPKTIGLEDSCRPISVRTDVEDRFRLLLMRLMEQVAEDGRIPIALKVTLRKFDNQKKTSHRETKQANILPSLFKSTPCTDTGGPKVLLAEGAQEKLIKIIMRLFERVVDMKKPFNITLIGLAFSKFQQRKVGSSSIANYLIKKADLEVQSITSLTSAGISATTDNNSPTPSISSNLSDEGFRSSPTTFQPSDQFYRRRTTTASPIPMLVDNGAESAATNSDFSDFSETEVEPSPKKSRFGRLLVAKRRCMGSSAICNSEASDVASPSKLRVCDLRLNSRDSEKDFSTGSCTSSPANTTTSSASTSIPSGCVLSTPLSKFRLNQPPTTLLHRIDKLESIRKTRNPQEMSMTDTMSVASLSSPMEDQSAITYSENPQQMLTEAASQSPNLPVAPASITTTSTSTKISANLSNIPCPEGVDPSVFNELPLDVKKELMASWRNSLAVAAAAVASRNVSSLAMSAGATDDATVQVKTGVETANGKQKNTLYRYFLRNK